MARSRVLALLTAAWLLVLTGSASATTFFVDAAAGHDTAAGTAAAPVRTINRAVSMARSGDTVEVRDGVYRETVAIGARGSGITYRAAEGARPVIDGEGTRAYGFKVRDSTGFVIDGFEVRGQTDAGIYLDTTSGVVRDNLVHDVGSTALTMSNGIRVFKGVANVVSDNIVHTIGPGYESIGIWLVQTRQAIVDSNVVYLVRKDGIRDWKSLDNSITSNRSVLNHNGISLNTTTGAYVANNQLDQNEVGLVAKHISFQTVLDYWALAEGRLSRFWHNTITSSTQTGMWIANSEEPMDHLSVRNNIVKGGGYTFLRDVPGLRGPNVTLDNNLYVQEPGGRPSAIYKEGWRTDPPALTDWETFTGQVGWEANGRLVTEGQLDTPTEGPDLGDAYGTQLGARDLPPAPLTWAPIRMRPVASSPIASRATQQNLGRVSDDNQRTTWLTDTGSNEWVTLDLGSSQSFNTIVLTMFSHDDNRNVRDFRFEASDDQLNWRTILEGTNLDTSQSSWKYRLGAPVTAQYLRYTMVSTSCQSYEPRTNCASQFVLSDVAAGMLTEAGIALAPEPTPSPTQHPSSSPSPIASPSASPTASPAPSASPTASPAPSASPTASPAPSASPTASPTASPSPTASANASPSPNAPPSPSPSQSPTASPSRSPAPAPATLSLHRGDLHIGSPFATARVARSDSVPQGLAAKIMRHRAFLRRLPRTWARFLRLRGGLGGRAYSRSVAARIVGITPSAAAVVERRALERLQQLAAA
jgi:hypothetical protein